MKSRILQKIIAVGTILIMGASGVVPVMATDPSTGGDGVAAAKAEEKTATDSGSFLGLTPWYEGLTKSNGELKDVKDNCSGDCVPLTTFITTIAMNILTDATVIAAYLTLGFVIYGGYKYIFSYGDVGKVATGKKTLTSAFIGLAIVMLAYVIFNTIKFVLITNAGGASEQTINLGGEEYKLVGVEASNLFNSIVRWIIGISGVVAAIFLVYGGITYVTSSGDAGKVEKAKKVILYSLIGLAIVGLSSLITGAISSAIRESAKVETTSNVKVLMIGKGGQK